MKNWIEIIALVIAAGAMVISAIQTTVLIQTVDAPYKSNLQDRQIDACVGLIEAYSTYAGSAGFYPISAYNMIDITSKMGAILTVPESAEPLMRSRRQRTGLISPTHLLLMPLRASSLSRSHLPTIVVKCWHRLGS